VGVGVGVDDDDGLEPTGRAAAGGAANLFDIPDRGLGYVSGHSAVAFALATVASPFLGRRARRVAWTLAGLVCVARIYVGSHLPLDVVGGAARSAGPPAPWSCWCSAPPPATRP
jgi:hypothetical protein